MSDFVHESSMESPFLGGGSTSVADGHIVVTVRSVVAVGVALPEHNHLG